MIKHITFKSPEESFTLMDNYFIKGGDSKKIIEMKPLDVSILSIHFEDLFDTNQFCIIFRDYFYHDKKWFLLDETYPELKACILVTDQEIVNEPFNPNIEHLFCKLIKQNNYRQFFGKSFTLFLPQVKNYNVNHSKKGVIFSHVIPELFNIKDKKKYQSLTGTSLEFNPKDKKINGKISIMSQSSLNENCSIVFIDNLLPVDEPKTFSREDVHYNKDIMESLQKYFEKKVSAIVSNLSKIITSIKQININDMFSACMIDSETSDLLRLFYNLKKNKQV